MSIGTSVSEESRAERNKRRELEWLQAAWADDREDAIDAFLHPDILIHGTGDGVMGREAYRAARLALGSMFRDLRIEAMACHAQGDLTATRLRIRGTYLGGLGIAPTGLPGEVQILTFTRWQDGLAIEAWEMTDMSALYRQLGARLVGPEAA